MTKRLVTKLEVSGNRHTPEEIAEVLQFVAADLPGHGGENRCVTYYAWFEVYDDDD